MKKLVLYTAVASTVIGCSTPNETSETIVKEIITNTDESGDELASLNVDSLVTEINAKRTAIEENLKAPVTISTANLREKVKQKWEKIDFYVSNNEVIRIKTYPYKGISSRTEEFYLEAKQVILAVIEDNGAGERGKAKEEIDKLYYYHNGEFLKEVNKETKSEYAIKKSDAEELLSEVKEYLEIYTNRDKK